MCKGGGARSPRVNVRIFVMHDEGSFMAQCGQRYKMENKLAEIQNGELGLFDEMSEAKMLHNQDRRAFALRKREFGTCKTRFGFLREQHKEGSRVQAEVSKLVAM